MALRKLDLGAPGAAALFAGPAWPSLPRCGLPCLPPETGGVAQPRRASRVSASDGDGAALLSAFAATRPRASQAPVMCRADRGKSSSVRGANSALAAPGPAPAAPSMQRAAPLPGAQGGRPSRRRRGGRRRGGLGGPRRPAVPGRADARRGSWHAGRRGPGARPRAGAAAGRGGAAGAHLRRRMRVTCGACLHVTCQIQAIPGGPVAFARWSCGSCLQEEACADMHLPTSWAAGRRLLQFACGAFFAIARQSTGESRHVR